LALHEACLRFAADKYLANGRHAWASDTLLSALVPLLVDNKRAGEKEFIDACVKAWDYAACGPCYDELDNIVRRAARLGYSCRIHGLHSGGLAEMTKREPNESHQ